MQGVATIQMDRNQARKAMADYRRAVKARQAKDLDEVKQRLSAEDKLILDGYRHLSRGHQLLNLHDAMANAKCNAKGQPALAIARADAPFVNLDREWFHGESHLLYWSGRSRNGRNEGRRIRMPQRLVPGISWPRMGGLRAMVPSIPPQYRPDGALHRYHILWEAEWEPIPPVDPMLLKHIKGPLYAVLAAWDLTEVERLVLGISRG